MNTMNRETLIVIAYIFSYLTVGIAVSFYMIDFYMGKLGRPIHIHHLFLATIGPLVWPLQIIKHLVDRRTLKKDREI